MEISLKCSFCNKSFQRKMWKYNSQVKQGNNQFFCSRKCYKHYSKQHLSKNLIYGQKKYTPELKKHAQEMRIFGMSYESIANSLAKELKIEKFPSGSVSYLVRQ